MRGSFLFLVLVNQIYFLEVTLKDWQSNNSNDDFIFISSIILVAHISTKTVVSSLNFM